MSTKFITAEVYRLTISGLEPNTDYLELMAKVTTGTDGDIGALMRKVREKSHALAEFKKSSKFDNCVGLRFLSFKNNLRPDVLDTKRHSLGRSPLTEDQANVEWTHAVIGLDPNRSGKFLLVLEKNIHGIYAGTLEEYIQWLIHQHSNRFDRPKTPIVVSLTAEPGAAFIQRLNKLDRISKATLRVVRPNPGWRDLEDSLSEQADESDARRVDVEMAARRGESLNKQGGIVEKIIQKFRDLTLDFASITGEEDGQDQTFTTDKLGKKAQVEVETDSYGQVSAPDTWKELAKILRSPK